jgi:hypothetical protein
LENINERSVAVREKEEERDKKETRKKNLLLWII